MNAHEHKALKSRQAMARAEADAARDEFRRVSDRLNGAEKELREVGRLISEGERQFQITEHALLRYVERVAGFDVQVAQAALDKELRPLVEALGDGKYPIKDTRCVAVVRGKTVVTVEPV